ncbi:MAG: hypothetical protein PHY48_11145 [Candidatus Cloacimonetes bacterium]|nr:hypothetical protein [Candidatus Cloacimonadota bacterium]
MKVTLKAGLKGYSGKMDDVIYYYHPRLGRTLMRRKPKNVKPTPMNDTYRSVSKNLKALEISEAYKADFSTYLSKLRDEQEHIHYVSWYNLFIKMMWAMQAANPEVNLATLSRAQIEQENLPCKSVKDAVEAGLLQQVKGDKSLTALI